MNVISRLSLTWTDCVFPVCRRWNGLLPRHGELHRPHHHVLLLRPFCSRATLPEVFVVEKIHDRHPAGAYPSPHVVTATRTAQRCVQGPANVLSPLCPNRSSLCSCLSTQPSITSWTTATTSSPQSSTLSGCTEPSSLCSSPTSGCRLT